MGKIGRNAPCPCGSGKKYKQCCINKRRGFTLGQKLMISFFVLVMAAGAVMIVLSAHDYDDSGRPGQVWSEEHQHWHPAG